MDNLLILDDSYDIRALLTEIFKNDYNILDLDKFAGNSNKIIDFKPNLAILDLNLGNENGISIATILKKHFNLLKIYILTGSNNNNDSLSKLKGTLIEDYFYKNQSPFNIYKKIVWT